MAEYLYKIIETIEDVPKLQKAEGLLWELIEATGDSNNQLIFDVYDGWGYMIDGSVECWGKIDEMIVALEEVIENERER